MSDEEIRIFIDGTVRYFERVSGVAPEVETPYIKGEGSIALDFTGVIGISGRHHGAVYFTSGRDLLAELLTTLGEKEQSLANLADMVGEVANTIAGNARRFFGHEFLISVPVVLRGRPEEISFPRHLKSFVIPVVWKGHPCFLIICLERSPMFAGASMARGVETPR